jgi:glycosyltransferase involved in cell wall biosynthesis
VVESILVLAHRYPPINTSGVYRTLFFFNHIADRGKFKVYVIAPNWSLKKQGQNFDEGLLLKISKNINVRRTGLWSIRESVINFKKHIPFGQENFTRDLSQSVSSDKCKGRKSFFSKCKDYLTEEILSFPDQDNGWLPFAYKHGVDAVLENDIKIIYSSGGPWTSHVVAFLISKRTGVPMVLDYRDPWYGNPFHNDKSRLYKSLSVYIENKILRNAKRIICNTNNLEKMYIEKFGCRGKTTVIPNGWEECVGQASVGKTLERCSVITHAGSLYGDRSATNFIKAVVDLIKENKVLLKVQFVGAGDDTRKHIVDEYGPEWLDNVFLVTPRVDHDICREYLLQSDVLLLFQQGTSLQVPRKLYEYVAMKKPVVAICGDGETKEIIDKNDFGLTACDDISEIQKVILKMVNSYSYSVNDVALNSYDNRKLSYELEQVFSEILEN